MTKKEEEKKEEKQEVKQSAGKYTQMYQDAKKDGGLKTLTPEYFEFKSPGMGFVGKFLGRNPVKSSVGDGDYYQYLFHTDGGLIKCAFGRATDNEAGSLLQEDSVYHVLYHGQEKISNTRRVNKFTIERILTEADAVVGGTDDIAF